MMKLSNASRCAVGLAAALVIGGVACKATAGLECQVVIAGQSGTVKFSYDGRDLTADRLPANNRADVKFLDKDGHEIGAGATGVAQGDKVPVPAGAAYIEISGASSASNCTGCTPPSGGNGGGGGTGGMFGEDPRSQSLSTSGPASPIRKWVHVVSLGADMDGSTAWGNLSASFTVQGSPDANQIHQQIVPLLAGGQGTPVPSAVDVETLVRIRPEKQGGRMFIADHTSGFTQMSMQWNGQPFATLGGSNVSASVAPNGWQVLELLIPASAFQVTPNGGSSNSMDLTWQTVEDVTVNDLTGNVLYY